VSANLGCHVLKEDNSMPENRKKTDQGDSQMEAEGLPVVRANVAGIDLGSKQHWVCAP
jgi:hypothetical protein